MPTIDYKVRILAYLKQKVYEQFDFFNVFSRSLH